MIEFMLGAIAVAILVTVWQLFIEWRNGRTKRRHKEEAWKKWIAYHEKHGRVNWSKDYRRNVDGKYHDSNY